MHDSRSVSNSSRAPQTPTQTPSVKVNNIKESQGATSLYFSSLVSGSRTVKRAGVPLGGLEGTWQAL